MTTFRMPSLGADMQAGTLVAWKHRPGEMVQRGDVLAEVDTDKGVIDVEVFTAGVIDELLVEPGTRLPVGAAMATIRDHVPTSSQTPQPPETGEERPVYGPGLAVAEGRLKISPAARRLARERGVDPGSITGTGRGGAIREADILRAAGSTGDELPPSAESCRQARMRQSIAAAMSRSKREIPHFYLATTIDMQASSRWVDEQNSSLAPDHRLLIGALLVKATALAVAEVPEVNAIWEEGRLRLRKTVHVGLAIALRGGGLVILAVHDTARLSLGELSVRVRDLTARARTGRMRSSELADATLTVTSLGDRGVEAVWGVIYPPQVAIVGFGSVVERPWAEDGGLFVRPVLTASLAADHRAIDGHRAGLFLARIGELLQEPARL